MSEKKTNEPNKTPRKKKSGGDVKRQVSAAASKISKNKSAKDNARAAAELVTVTVSVSGNGKKHNKAFTVISVLLVIALVCVLVFGYFQGWFDGLFKPAGVVSGDLSVHFLELGNNYTGDSVYIKAGDTDILIDAGSRAGSADAISKYVDKYCTDGKLEYVIATHAHQDHIAGFVGTKAAPGIFDKYECETIIEFARTDSDTAVYKNYREKRDAEKESGAKVYTALECVEEQNGAQKEYDLTGDGSITMEILDQKYYRDKSSDENNYSVCLLITQGSNNYLFTGDLEKEGEESLVEENSLPEVELFKGGHHGSPTSSTDKLLSVIKPKTVCVCCCAGSVEYTQNKDNTFPSQAFIDRIAPYTDSVYVTTLGIVEYDSEKQKYVDKGFASFNGCIIFSCTDGIIKITCSNNDIKLKDSEWFNANRKRPAAWAA